MNTFLEKLMQSHRLPHGLLVTGSDAVELKSATQKIIAMQECESNMAKRPCEQCPVCHKINKGIHTDIFTVVSNQKEIVAETMREAMRWLMVRPSEMQHRYLVIFEAEWMSRSSANSLLKILEEPPAHGRILLVTTNVQEILQTLRSRTIKVHIPTPTSPVIENKGDNFELIEEALKLFTPDASRMTNLAPLEELGQNKELLPTFFKLLFIQTKNRMLALSKNFHHLVGEYESFLDILLQIESSVLNHYGNSNLSLHYLYFYWKKNI